MELLDILEQSIQSHQLNRAIMIEKGGRHLNDEDGLDELLNDMQSQVFDDADPSSQALKKKVEEELTKVKEASCAPTSFPVKDADAITAIDDPLGRLEELMAELSRHREYRIIRKEYCELSILLNLKGVLAPAFRPELKTGKSFGNNVFLEIHRDQIVIDCHWLYAKKSSVNSKVQEWRPMFYKSKPFPFDLAWLFASKKWKGLNRAIEVLRLTPFLQCQLLAIRGPSIKARFDNIYKGTRSGGIFKPSNISLFLSGLNEWCERDVRMLRHQESYEKTWLARELLGSKASINQIGELSALMLGETQKDNKTTRTRLENIERHILGASLGAS